jgi:hypothetical protein
MDQITHQFMYPQVTPVHGTAPRTDSGGPASSVGTHNDNRPAVETTEKPETLSIKAKITQSAR